MSKKNGRPGIPPSCMHGTHGVRAIAETVKRLEENGGDWLAELGELGRAAREFRDDLVDHAGGAEHVSVVERIFIEEAAKEWLMVQSFDRFILQRPLINKRKREVFPIVQQRQKLVESMMRKLEKLGMKKKPKPISPHEWEPPTDAA